MYRYPAFWSRLKNLLALLPERLSEATCFIVKDTPAL
jgi:hypothetical protein